MGLYLSKLSGWSALRWMCPALANGDPLAVMTMVVAPFLRAMSQASIKSRVRPELLMTTTQSPGSNADALITCMWPSL